MKILVIDVGGTNIKLLATGRRAPIKIPSGPDLTPAEMVSAVIEATKDWTFEAVTIGYPGPVMKDRPTREPVNLGPGWVDFDYVKALKVPVKMINDAAMQALGSYDGGVMLFLGLGTGLGTTLVTNGTVVPLEIAHLPYRKERTYEEYVGEAGLKHLGEKKWKRHVERIVNLFLAALNAEYAVLGGGNVRHFENDLPPNTRRGSNLNAFRGGYRLWQKRAHLP
ncbi:MAG: polyphosphate glucokinase [Gemmatimonadetes bacterium]|nr:polyphosphate glucokinase [Gemmatimonadota bacterium]